MPLAIAHRGDPINERENTLGAFEAAVKAGADMVEIDLQRTRDGHVVVLHDASLERLWEVSHDVGELDLAQIARIGSGDCRVPTLREVLDTIGVPLMVDFTGEEVVHGALEEVRRARAAERCMFVTGNVPALRMLRSLAPAVRIGLTWTKAEAPPRWLLDELRADFWNPWFPLLRVDDVAEMHAAGTQVSTWTVDEHEDMVRVLSAGVDAVVSNRIHELRSMLSGPEPRARTP